MKKFLSMLMVAVMLLSSITFVFSDIGVSYAKISDLKIVDPYTGGTYTHASKFKDRTVVTGIDVSQWQGKIDWKKVKADGIDFAFVRVGYRGYGTSGELSEDTKDTYFDYNMKNAIAAGVDVGVYVFSQAITEKEAEEEANYILKHIKKYDVKFPLIFDFEYAGNPGRLEAAKLSRSKATNVCLAFCKTVEDAGYTPLVYSNPYMMKYQLYPNKIKSAGYRVWLANYTSKTDYEGDYDFWQYACNGKVDGITEAVDMNFYYKQDSDNFMSAKKSIKKASVLKIKDCDYTGSPLEPEVTVKYKNKVLEEGYDYELEYSNNIQPGKATVTVLGKGKYMGTVSYNFVVKPGQMTPVSLISKGSDTLTMGWQSSAGVSGYQVYRATTENGKYKKVKTIKKGTTFFMTDKGLDSGRSYYYKIRSYVKCEGKNYYSPFSEITKLSTSIDGKRTAIITENSEIFKKASVSSKSVIEVPKNSIIDASVMVEDADGDIWYKVSYKKDGVVYKGYMLYENMTIGAKGTVISGSDINVMSKTSSKSNIVSTVSNGTEINVISTVEKKNVTWYKIAYQGKDSIVTGWITLQSIKMK